QRVGEDRQEVEGSLAVGGPGQLAYRAVVPRQPGGGDNDGRGVAVKEVVRPGVEQLITCPFPRGTFGQERRPLHRLRRAIADTNRELPRRNPPGCLESRTGCPYPLFPSSVPLLPTFAPRHVPPVECLLIRSRVWVLPVVPLRLGSGPGRVHLLVGG